MERIRLSVAGMLLLFFSGCGGVLTTVPIGDEVSTINEKEWEGDWIFDDGVMSLGVVDAKQGVLKAIRATWDKKRLNVEEMDVWLRQTGGWMFANCRDAGAKEKTYIWMRVKLDGDRLLLFFPDKYKFKRLVKEKKFSGDIEDDRFGLTITLKELTPEQQKLIASEKEGVLFEWDEPIVLRRLKKNK